MPTGIANGAAVPVVTGSVSPLRVSGRSADVTLTAFGSSLRLPSHRHERACITVVLEGRFEESFGGRGYVCSPGTLLAKPPGELHADRFATMGSRQVIIEPDPAEGEVLAPTAALVERVQTLQQPGIGGLAHRLAREITQPDALSPVAIEALVLELLATASRISRDISRGTPPGWLRRAREILHDANGATPDIRSLAAEVGVHPAHLSRCFSAWFGVPVGEYVRRLRIETAAADLARTELSLAGIGLRAGFADQSHFTRTFKRYTGLTPLQYRRAARRVR